MKKISLFTLAVCTGLALNAQDQPIGSGMAHGSLRTPMAKKVMFGLHGGLNMPRYHVTEDDYANPQLAPSTNRKTTFHVGAMVDIPIAGAFHITPEVTYARKGSKLTEKTQTGTGTTLTPAEEDLHYLMLAPLELKLQSPSGFFVQVGPHMGILLKARREMNNTTTDVKNARKKTDFGATGGIGYMSRIGLGAHARYAYGFSNVLNAEDVGTVNGNLNNRTLEFGIMYHFGAHK